MGNSLTCLGHTRDHLQGGENKNTFIIMCQYQSTV